MNETNEATVKTNVALWNPNATANWSLLFTPMFGAYLQAQNWRALGDEARAGKSMTWFYAGIGMLVLYILLAFLIRDEKMSDALARLIGLVFLLTWYFASGRAQAKYVKAQYGTAFLRKPWAKPLLIALGCFVGYFVAAVIVGVAIGALGLA